MSRFRKKPVEVEAWPVRELNRLAATDFWALPKTIIDLYDAGGLVFSCLKGGEGPERGIYVPTLEGSMFAGPDDLIIRGVAGEFYPCKPDIFAATYEPVLEAVDDSTPRESVTVARAFSEADAQAKHAAALQSAVDDIREMCTDFADDGHSLVPIELIDKILENRTV